VRLKGAIIRSLMTKDIRSVDGKEYLLIASDGASIGALTGAASRNSLRQP
jgi:hypothetical protein